MSKPIVAIIGKPNVGKSTFFNYLAGSRISIVQDTPGVTRDRVYADTNWRGRNFTLIDTGGIEPDSEDIILSQMREQANLAIQMADVIIFLTDIRQGVTAADKEIALMLKKSGKPIVLVCNKADNFEKERQEIYEFYNLGIGEPFPISATNAIGIGDVLDEIYEKFPPKQEGEEDDDVIIRVKGWEVEDGAYQHVYTGDVFDATSLELEAKQVMEDGSIDWYSIPENAITNIAIESYEVGGSSATATEVKNAGLYSLEITLDASKAEGLLYDGEVSPLPVRITPRDLSINIYLDGLTKDDIGKQLDPNNDLLWEYENGEDIGLVYDETPIFSGYIRISNTMNSAGKYDVYYFNIDIKDEGKYGFLKSNYNPIILINETEIKLGQEEEEQLPGGIDIDDDDSGSDSGSGIVTKRYQLYLANKDYTFPDAKEDYAAEGLELFSRHNKKYTNAGGSFTIWYEHNGEVNEGGYRVFWSSRANGEYKEVKLDEVSGYYQIRNVNSNVYVRIYAADGFPVGNEEISAADYRAYAQPNKIVVITPQPTDVQIISMAGAVVATDKVTGQREFANLTEGVYIVRMGETVVKLQVRK